MDIYKMPVFPAADMFPMMTEDELLDLMADIKANGMIDPITIIEIGDDAEEFLIDGRNRRKACKRLGIKNPAVTSLATKDPTAFVISVGLRRRNMTKGQQAMVYAKIYPEPETVKRAGSVKITELNVASISHARTVLKHQPDLVDSVVSGALALSSAYEAALSSKLEARTPTEKLAAVREHAPDLADQVVEEVLTLKQAEDELGVRREQERHRIEVTQGVITSVAQSLYFFSSTEFIESVRGWIDEDVEFELPTDLIGIDAFTDLEKGAAHFFETAKRLEAQNAKENQT